MLKQPRTFRELALHSPAVRPSQAALQIAFRSGIPYEL